MATPHEQWAEAVARQYPRDVWEKDPRWFERGGERAHEYTAEEAYELAAKAQRELVEMRQRYREDAYREPRMADYMLIVIGVVAGNFINAVVPKSVISEVRGSSTAQKIAAFFLLFLTLMFNTKSLSIIGLLGYAVVIYVWIMLVAGLTLVQFIIVVALLLVTALVAKYRFHKQTKQDVSDCHKQRAEELHLIENIAMGLSALFTVVYFCKNRSQ